MSRRRLAVGHSSRRREGFFSWQPTFSTIRQLRQQLTGEVIHFRKVDIPEAIIDDFQIEKVLKRSQRATSK
jgi:hypothetical protein